ncbi:unnamed protein product [Musa textilis]
MKVYVDDMIVKSGKASTHLADLVEAFNTLRKFGMHLNPEKCAFRVDSGKYRIHHSQEGDRCHPGEGPSHHQHASRPEQSKRCSD